MRTTARETVFKIVFASQFTEYEPALKTALYKSDNLDENDREYCDKVLQLVEEHRAEFEEILDNHSRLFPASVVFPADKSALFIALAEILFVDDVPSAVAVNEAANIASKYSSEKSASFISGILSEIIRELNNV